MVYFRLKDRENLRLSVSLKRTLETVVLNQRVTSRLWVTRLRTGGSWVSLQYWFWCWCEAACFSPAPFFCRPPLPPLPSLSSPPPCPSGIYVQFIFLSVCVQTHTHTLPHRHKHADTHTHTHTHTHTQPWGSVLYWFSCRSGVVPKETCVGTDRRGFFASGIWGEVECVCLWLCVCVVYAVRYLSNYRLLSLALFARTFPLECSWVEVGPFGSLLAVCPKQECTVEYTLVGSLCWGGHPLPFTSLLDSYAIIISSPPILSLFHFHIRWILIL